MKSFNSLETFFLIVSSLLLITFIIADHHHDEVNNEVVDVVVHHVFNETRCLNGVKITSAESYSNDSSKYVKCISDGVGVLDDCLPGSQFNVSQMSCIFYNETVVDAVSKILNNTTIIHQDHQDEELQENLTANNSLSSVSSSVSVLSSLNKRNNLKSGKMTGVTCLNGGVVDHFSNNGVCICLKNFTGDICEKVADTCNEYEKILNDTFDVEKFVHFCYDKISNESNESSQRSAMHLSNFSIHFNSNVTNISVNFEDLLITLVDQIWGEISAEQEYLRNFNYTRLTNCSDQKKLASLVQKLRHYSRFVSKSFESKFHLYRNVLTHLNQHLQNKSEEVRAYAIEFINEWNKNWVTLNETTSSAENDSQVKVQGSMEQVLNTSQIIKCMKEELNRTLVMTCELYKCASNLSANIHNISNLVERIKNSTIKNWNMIVDFGFWFLTNKLSNEYGSVVDQVPRLFAYSKKFSKRDDMNELSYPARNFKSMLSWNELFNPKYVNKNKVVVQFYKMVSSSSNKQ